MKMIPYYVPLLNGTQENLIVSLIESRSGSTEDKIENLISLRFASRKIAKLNSISPKNAFQTKSFLRRDGFAEEGGRIYTRGDMRRVLLFPARRKSFRDCFCRGFTNNSIFRISRLLTKIILLFRKALSVNDADVLQSDDGVENWVSCSLVNCLSDLTLLLLVFIIFMFEGKVN